MCRLLNELRSVRRDVRDAIRAIRLFFYRARTIRIDVSLVGLLRQARCAHYERFSRAGQLDRALKRQGAQGIGEQPHPTS